MNIRPFIPLIISSLLFLGSIGIYVGGYMLLEAGNREALTQAKKIVTKTDELKRMENARAALSRLADDESMVQSFSVNKEDIVEFLETIQRTGKTLGTSVDVVSVSNEKAGTHARIDLSLTVKGSFDAVLRTLGAIEYGPYDGVITSLSLGEQNFTEGSSTRTVWNAMTLYSVSLQASSTPGVASSTKP